MNILLFNEIGEKIMKLLMNSTKLNQSQIRLLQYFSETGNELLAMNDLAHELSISISTLSRQLNQEQTRSYLEFDLTSKDSTKHVHLSANGLIKAEELKKAITGLTDKIFAYSAQEEISFLRSELSMIIKKLS
ncbi:hypothetical protein FC62_GL000217 [Amylolactobacillus amylotrophicus DSM 20534]|uniref:Uncharacterized protein n=3 Tax=Amylolactobacillus TaxID=2767876 RepID=A0A1L6XE13_9LACO|nr:MULTISPECIES: MarR family winged helix-turn-helix transcriptional regulator [Amylolactobacillus]APT19195.1 hypothetical protein LA20533_08020 [Amylolactobacillus amylophilus DSM 20533 = JCM 1125]KRK38530.1 hypothetical protein FC62_GL000217 [Amylolactobacillus amylotrophicus DSM 20534]KRM42827.1 hypothetical protein FD40_GL000622 [Amylolactobacillus amylophilus DSM 20533 = JCM 1125]GED79690.1 MarR family transcriptional regulator [Amylolactobacillus amylophilus]